MGSSSWNLNVNPKVLEVKYDQEKGLFYLDEHLDLLRRTDITSVRDALNGYQKGKCFYSFKDISINPNSPKLCNVDHFLPHLNKLEHTKAGANIDGVWNLVLADAEINKFDKRAKVPARRFLARLFNRNEFYINSKHPLAETIVNQTGITPEQRKKFLERQYNLALNLSIHTWEPREELKGSF